MAFGIDGWSKLIDFRIGAVRTRCSVAEHGDVPGSRTALRNPTRIMLESEELVLLSASPIGLRISPAVKQIASLAGTTAGAPRGFLRRGAVVDNPHFIEGRHAQDDLIELRIVVDGIGMEHISQKGAASRRASIDVDPFGVCSGIRVVLESGIDVLNEMVPHMPFPDDPRPIWALGFELDQHVRPDAV